MNKKLSIIIPCYNSECYIERCLNSLINQKYKNVEIIVVDDGSTDSSGQIIRNIAKNDNRIRYIHKDNTGVSDTRNVGLQIATGGFITFVDSDDTVLPDIYTQLMPYFDEYDAAIVHCGYRRIESDRIKEVGNSGKVFFFKGDEVVSGLLRGNLFTAGVWNKIYRKNILSEIYFDKKYKMNEDVLFNFYVFKNANNAVYIDKPFYEYRIEETSSCKNAQVIKVAEDCYYVSEEIYKNCNKLSYADLAYNRLCNNMINLYRAYKFYGNKSQKIIAKSLREKIICDYQEHKLVGSQKYNGFIIKYFNFVYKPFYKIYNKIRKPNWDI